MSLFEKSRVVGIFRGFSKGGLEFHADLLLPYREDFQSMPMHGQFLLVQLESADEAVLGRITSIESQGRLTSSAGEDYSIRAVAEEREIPEDLRDQYLRYRIDLRVLGVIRIVQGNVVFVPSHRRLPHVGSKVALLSDELLREVSCHNERGAELGHLALGEFVFAGDDSRLQKEPWMRICPPAVVPRFDVSHMVARRTFVFARAGYGKSNLVKLIFSNLYKEQPYVIKRGEKQVPVGSIIFDPEGEFFWPDDRGRPGLCDVEELRDRLVVFTPRAAPSEYYGSFIGGDIRLDIRRFRPGHIISIALPPEKQDQQNVARLKQLTETSWRELVDLIHQEGNAADGSEIKRLLRLNSL